MTALIEPTCTTFPWPSDFERIPEAPWVDAPIDAFGLNYDNVGNHGWYKNLEPTVAMAVAALGQDKLMVDYSSGTGILTNRILARIRYPGGILNVDASSKFLRVALENFRHDERVAFRLLAWLKNEGRLEGVDEVVTPGLVDRGADLLTSTNAVHLYYDLPGTLNAWQRVLRPGALALISSANMRNPHHRPGDWIIDETVAKVNEIAA